MSANLQPNGSDDGELAPLAEINVTPLVDVMLVLLIIFMVAAPLMVSGVPVKLPGNAAAKDTPPPKPLVVSMAVDGRIYLRDVPMVRDAMIPQLAALRQSEGDVTVYVRADKTIPYGQVMDMLNEVSQAGFAKISLLSEVRGEKRR